MTNKDTFWCIPYKGCYIRGHHDRDLKKEVITILDEDYNIYDARNVRSAKWKITRHLCKEAKK